MPFAEDGGGVATLLNQLGKSHFIVAEADFGARAKSAVDAEAIGIAAGEQAATGRGANRLGDVEVAEDTPLRGEAVEIGSDETLCAEDADVGVALVVGKDDDDVGKGRRSGEGEIVRQAETDEKGQEPYNVESSLGLRGVLHLLS